MPSGKRSKRERRAASARPAPPPARAKGAPRQRRASPKVLAIGGGLVAVVVVVILVAVLAFGGGSSSVGTLPTSGSLVNALSGAADVQSLLKGIPQGGLTLGSPSAPVTMTEYIDLQCPYCDEFETQVAPVLISRYVRTGKVKIDARVLDFIGPDSGRGRNAMIAAGEQGKAFNFAQVLYDNQGTENTGWLSDQMVARAAESVPGLNPKQLFAQRDSGSVQATAAKIDAQARSDKVSATPTIYVGKSGTHGTIVPLKSPTDQATLFAAIDAALTS